MNTMDIYSSNNYISPKAAVSVADLGSYKDLLKINAG